MNIKDTLLHFLSYPLDTADPIFDQFLLLPEAQLRVGKLPGERFLFISGSRPDAATLVAHADTVFDVAGDHSIIVDDDIIRSGSSLYGIGADDRAGCAMLWLLRDLGHHLLICDYEESSHADAEGSLIGAKYLMREHSDIARIINSSSFMLEFDRRLAYSTRKEHYTTYDLPVSKAFRDFLEGYTGFIDDDNKGGTDILALCTEVCGANICVGYANAHTPQEFISISAFQNTYNLMLNVLSQQHLERFPLLIEKSSTSLN